jgi:UrcA family protein
MVAASFIGVALTTSSTHAFAQPPVRVIVEGQRVHAERISYADLNLARSGDQAALHSRIYTAATHVCRDFNGAADLQICRRGAINNADDQFEAAVARAEQQMAGLPVGPAIAISVVAGGL